MSYLTSAGHSFSLADKKPPVFFNIQDCDNSNISWEFDAFGDGLIVVNFNRDVPLKIRFITSLFINSKWSCTIET